MLDTLIRVGKGFDGKISGLPQRSLDISQTTSHLSSIRTASLGAAARQKQIGFVRALFQKNSTKRKALRFGLVSFNLVILAGVIGFFVLQPRMDARNPNYALAADTTNDLTASPLDQLSSANIALTVARMADLPETTAITNQADSEDVAVAQAATEDAAIASKPQIVASEFKSVEDIKTYVAVSGDTVATIASKFGVTSDSIRWSNNLSSNNVPVGKTLHIPPVSGVIYTVGAGDNAATIAAKFNADKDKIIAFNDAELTGLTPGQRIVVPGGTKVAMIARAPGSFALSGAGGRATYGYNGYDYGYCTYWVAVLRAKAGNPVPTNLGNASTWAVRAARYGLPTGSTPRVGAAVVTKTSGWGHVAYVTAVHDDGSITISEMNHVGWNRTNERVISGNFSYIY